MSEYPEKRTRLLKEACRIFAEKGFRDATVAEICEAADANVAAVNYYFKNKETLYDEVWRCAFALTVETHPLDGGLPENPTIEEYLFCYARAVLRRIFSEDASGLFAKLLSREMASPTLALGKIATDYIIPQSQHMEMIVSKMLGSDSDEKMLMLCRNSIIAQCAFYNFSRPLREKMMGKTTMSAEELDYTARHIARFSLGGLKEINPGKL